MSLSAIFIPRPVATTLLMLAVMVAGYVGYRQLPVASLPSAEQPTISVSASLPGASPETMAASVATPLIKQFETIAGIDQISASSKLGSTSITIQFNLKTDIDAAAADVQAAMSRVTRQLPDNMSSPPSYRKVNPASAPIMLIALTSEGAPLTQVDDIAENVIAPTLATLPGVAQAVIYGAQTRAVRIDVDPAKLDARGLSMATLAQRLSATNDETPLGVLQTPTQRLTLSARTEQTDAEAFRTLVIAEPDGKLLRLGDVARVSDGIADPYQGSWFDGRPSILLAVQRQPDANTVEVADAVRARLPQIEAALPPGVSAHVMSDASLAIKAAVKDVQETLIITIALVILVIWLFLRRLWATLIPAVAVPLSLISALGMLYVLGFSLDNISLLGLTLSVGLVVDDAIVMLENIVRRMELGETPREAALKGSREVTGTIVSMSLSLVAVFLPILLMGGAVGRILNEFGVVVTLAILASALVSLIVTPMMAARLPVTVADHDAPGIGRRINTAYSASVGWCLRHQGAVLLVFLATAAWSVHVFATIPRSFFPAEDLGTVNIYVQARQDISYDAMKVLQDRAAAVVQANPAVAHVDSILRSNQTNRGTMYVQLVPREDRPPIADTVADLRRKLAEIPGIRTYVSPNQSLRIGGRSTQSTYQLVLQAIDSGLTNDWAARLAEAMQADPAHFVDVASDQENRALEAQLVFDRDAASRLGVTAGALRDALRAGFGSYAVTQVQTTGSSYDVILQYDPSFQWDETALDRLRVPGAGGALIPLAAFTRVERGVGPVAVNQTGQLTSVTLSFNLPDGVSLGAAEARIEALKAEIGMPSTVITSYAGAAALFKEVNGNTNLLIGAAILTIYIVLGILYESFIHPLTILSGLPSAALGSLLALQLFGFDLSLIALIGLLMLIGIVKKNAIMMIDVALDLQRSEGMPPAQAIRIAAERRFRPIMMTTFCALLGVLPIALGTGASSELRQPLGVAVVGGLVFSQVLTLYITPVIFVRLEALSAWLGGRRRAAGAQTPAAAVPAGE